MKRSVIVITLVIGMIFSCCAFPGDKKGAPGKQKGFALIELFSSEGCSSCPPAEKLMRKLIHNADSLQLPVYVLEFHVDYWDYLGWKDTLASSSYTQRQQNYGDFFRLNSIYTPQAVVNGKYEMIGSDEDKINQSVVNELSDSSSYSIACTVNKLTGPKIEVEYNIAGNVSGNIINFAVMESNLVTYIKKGENANKTLIHDNAVRVFRSVKPDSAKGKISIDIQHINLNHCKLVCFLQNIDSGKIIAAEQLKIE
jgi:hypothetical protein